MGETFHPQALTKISILETQPEQTPAGVPEPDYEGPFFLTHLNNVEIKEEESAHFECRVEPSKDPTLTIGEQLLRLVTRSARMASYCTRIQFR